MSDDKPLSNDHETYTDEVLPPVCANIVFDLTNPEGERRLRDCLDASKLRAVLWNLVHGPNGIFGIFDVLDEEDDRFEDALRWTLGRINDLCDKYNIDLED